MPRVIRRVRTIFTPEDDEVLRFAYVQGWRQKRDAVRTVLNRHPETSRRAVWRRARRVCQESEIRSEPVLGRGPWSKAEIDLLMRNAGTMNLESLREGIARTDAAIRKCCSRLGISVRVKDAQSQRALCRELHIGRKRLQDLVRSGRLRLTNPRIRVESLIEFCKMHARELGVDCRRLKGRIARYQKGFSLERIGQIAGVEQEVIAQCVRQGELRVEGQVVTVPALQAFCEVHAGSVNVKRLRREVNRHHYSADRLAHLLSVPVEEVHSWIGRRWLEVADAHITYDSLEEFYRRGGADLNLHLFPKEVRRWAIEEMGAKEQDRRNGNSRLAGFQKHLSRVMVGRCGRKIRGNAFFRHARKCKVCQGKAAVAKAKATA
jgi:hypothetical protein